MRSYEIVLLGAMACGSRTGLDQTRVDAGIDAFSSTTIESISTGADHACVVLSDHTVRCWGYNAHGQVGNGGGYSDREDVLQATPVVGLTDPIRKVSAGAVHTCALSEQGNVFCWGRGAEGQIGDGAGRARVAATFVAAGAIDVVAAGYFSCAVMRNGGARCWGDNENGNLGDGTTTNRATPVDVVGLHDARAITADEATTYALLRDGTVVYWGVNLASLDPDAAAQQTELTPIPFLGLAGVEELSPGCAILASRQTLCWGMNHFGEVGDGTTSPRYVPVAIFLGGSPKSVTSGLAHRCATRQAGDLLCWGSNKYGQLGDGTQAERHEPTIVMSVIDVVSASAGGSTCAVVENGRHAKCWGNNGNGELGNGTYTSSAVPTTVIGVP